MKTWTTATENPRLPFIEAAAIKADPRWVAAYSDFICEWLTENGPAIAETIRLGYEKRRDLPQLVSADKRASGQVFRSLMHKGKIEATGEYERSVLRSSPMAVYRIKL